MGAGASATELAMSSAGELEAAVAAASSSELAAAMAGMATADQHKIRAALQPVAAEDPHDGRAQLTSLPTDLWTAILKMMHPRDRVASASVCRSLHASAARVARAPYLEFMPFGPRFTPCAARCEFCDAVADFVAQLWEEGESCALLRTAHGIVPWGGVGTFELDGVQAGEHNSCHRFNGYYRRVQGVRDPRTSRDHSQALLLRLHARCLAPCRRQRMGDRRTAALAVMMSSCGTIPRRTRGSLSWTWLTWTYTSPAAAAYMPPRPRRPSRMPRTRLSSSRARQNADRGSAHWRGQGGGQGVPRVAVVMPMAPATWRPRLHDVEAIRIGLQ